MKSETGFAKVAGVELVLLDSVRYYHKVGGTAINKLLFEKPLRYSEDIDLVQIQAEPIRETLDAMREALAWLGKFSYSQARHSTHLVFKFSPESAPSTTLKVKIEINTREHEHMYKLKHYPFKVESDWYKIMSVSEWIFHKLY